MMPVLCNISVERLSTDKFRELDYRVMRHAFESQNDLGRLADERIYQSDLAARLQTAGMQVKREVKIQISHREFRKSLYLDLLVAEQAVYELKVAKAITDEHRGQLLTYLHLLDIVHGKLINFRSVKVESQFVNAPLDSATRRSFRTNDAKFDGDTSFRDLIVGLIRDWGTSLTLSLYHEAMTVLLGGFDRVEAMLPIKRNGIPLGNQRFQLVNSDTAFKFTALNHDTSSYHAQLKRLIQFSPLRAIHWINIAHHEVALTTIHNCR